MATKSYYVGNASLVKRLDTINPYGAQSWDDKSSNFSSSPGGTTYGGAVPLKDVKTDPSDADKVFVVGQAFPSGGFKGIAVSTNAGNSWFTPGLTPAVTAAISSVAGFTFYEVWPVNSTTIYACGSNGYVIKSTDGGLTFDVVTQIAIVGVTQPDVYSIHFPMANVGVVGLYGYVFKTIDGGVTWVNISGFLGSSNAPIKGIYLSNNQQVIVGVCDLNIIRSSNGGSTFNIQYNFPRTGNHLTWFRDGFGNTTFWATAGNNEIVSSSDDGVTWAAVPGHSYNATSPDNYLAAHFYTATNGFIAASPTVPFASLRIGANDIVPSDNATGAKSIEAVWTTVVLSQCYRLVSCDVQGDNVDVITNTNLSQYVGQTITALGPNNTDLGCRVVSITDCIANPVQVSVVQSYTDCDSCNDGCYELVNCEDNTEVIVVREDLEDYIYQSVQIDSCPGKCFYVRRGPCVNVSTLPVLVTTSYTSCNDCLGIVPETFELHTRRVKPGFYTPGCPPEYTTKINCKFASQYYDEMVSRRYGITICCDHDIDKWEIKKQLLDLKSIYDPDLCTYKPTPCQEPCNVTAEITYNLAIPYSPIPPPGPDCPMPQGDPDVTFNLD